MRAESPIISLVVPCYNEEVNIQKGVLDKIGNFTRDNRQFSEVIIVDDNSPDGTGSVAEQNKKKHLFGRELSRRKLHAKNSNPPRTTWQ